ncbi:hypothetical protein EG68_06174 [Paragonimus skrjabini miyazakii]|uniref:Uncharacterized protein n=1 Tax=Paragonimus skrjabini miyazakii TaxID=59628 RepID=A0A8S9YUE5_9TREM|nr:hypothetical protein EG68_06174 [Paragonimus skrjabini miyazakii]
MAIHISHPQVILYWTELLIGIICVALVGRGYNERHIQYLITVCAGFAVGNVVFLLLYAFASCRPPQGRSVTKLVESIYQITAVVLYCIGLGCTTLTQEYLQHLIGPMIIFIGMNLGTYIFGSLLALTELVCTELSEPPPSLPYPTPPETMLQASTVPQPNDFNPTH